MNPEAACWLCGHAFADNEPRRGAEVPAGDAKRPPFEAVIVCLGCYHDFGICPRGRRYTVQIETRLPGLASMHARAALLHGLRTEFAS